MNETIVVNELAKKVRVVERSSGLQANIKSFFLRQYHTKEIIKPLDFSIRSGEIVGLLGPNGAGKTTVMKMLSGIMHPSAGNISVLGYVPHLRKKDFLSQIALVMGQKAQLLWDLPAMSSFRLISKYYEIPHAKFQDNVENLSSLLNVADLLYRPMRKLSLGERMKLELMAALLHDPQILFLDEPTIGLDIIAQQSIRSFLQEYHLKKGGSIILTSHYMADIEALCSRLILLIDGEKYFDGSLNDFSALASTTEQLSVGFSQPCKENDPIIAAYTPVWTQDKTGFTCSVIAADLQTLGKHIFNNYNVTHFSTKTMPIEDALNHILHNL